MAYGKLLIDPVVIHDKKAACLFPIKGIKFFSTSCIGVRFRDSLDTVSNNEMCCICHNFPKLSIH